MIRMVMWCDVKVRMIWYYNFLLKISLGRMILDICKFCCLYLLVLFAFSCGDLDDGDDVGNDSHFDFDDRCFQNLYKWGFVTSKTVQNYNDTKNMTTPVTALFHLIAVARYEPVAVVLRRVGTAALSWGGSERNPAAELLDDTKCSFRNDLHSIDWPRKAKKKWTMDKSLNPQLVLHFCLYLVIIYLWQTTLRNLSLRSRDDFELD